MKSLKKNRLNRLGNRQGYWEDYRFNGTIYSKGYYKNGKPEGYWEYYYRNGNIKTRGQYINGVKDGKWDIYYVNGGLSRIVFYKGDEIIEVI